jgi:hypothetical protein
LKFRAVVRSCNTFLLRGAAGPRSCKKKSEGTLLICQILRSLQPLTSSLLTIWGWDSSFHGRSQNASTIRPSEVVVPKDKNVIWFYSPCNLPTECHKNSLTWSLGYVVNMKQWLRLWSFGRRLVVWYRVPNCSEKPAPPSELQAYPEKGRTDSRRMAWGLWIILCNLPGRANKNHEPCQNNCIPAEARIDFLSNGSPMHKFAQ